MQKTVATLTVLFTLAFISMIAFGSFLIYKEVSQSTTNKVIESSKSDLKLKVSGQETSFEITNAIPGVIIFVFGSIGLISLVYRLPVKEVLGYEDKGGGNGSSGFMYREKILSKNTLSVPYPIWLLLKSSERLEKVDEIT